MNKTNNNHKNYKPFQQYNNNIHLYRKFLFYIICLITLNFSSQDSLYKRFYFPSGEISSEGYFVNSLPAGEWKNYYANGNIKSTGFWKAALLDSSWTFYDTSGNKILEEHYLNNKKNGKIIKYDTLENIIYLANYIQGLKQGEEFFLFSSMNQIQFKNNYEKNKKNGFCYEYNYEGDIITIFNYDMGVIIEKEEINRKDRDNKKHGVWKEFFKNGKVKKEVMYFHGLIDGISKKYNKEGGIEKIENYNKGEQDKQQIKLAVSTTKIKIDNGNIIEGVVFESAKQGLFKIYNQEGEIINYQYYQNDTLYKEGMYDSTNQKTGVWNFYWSNKNIKKKGKYISGKKDSLWVYFYNDGKIQQKGEYKLNVPEGKWYWWYNNDKIKREEVYLNGKEDGIVIEYDSIGKVITKGQYSFGQREGDWFYIINDYKEEGKYISGMKTGLWETTYISTKKKKFEGEFLNDIPLGEHKEYFPNGIIKYVGKYKNGEKHGEWKKYNIKGELIVTFLFKNGEEIKRDGLKIK
tara:strand:+ start:1857 stop:3413 length:1557 start_codon:yes stop_codon:yes gene_type:complete